MKQMQSRMKKEMDMLQKDPPPGVSAWFKDDNINEITARKLN